MSSALPTDDLENAAVLATANQTKIEPQHHHHHDDDDDDDDDDVSSDSSESKEEFDFIESTWESSVETGLVIQWPGSQHRPLRLSTKMTEDAIAPLFDGTQWAGTRVWKAAIVALEYLLQEYNDSSSNRTGSKTATRVFELGCGLGVPSMLWHLLQEDEFTTSATWSSSTTSSSSTSTSSTSGVLPPRVVLTDMPDLLPQLEGNVQTNFPDHYGTSIQAKALDWSAQGLRKLWEEEETLVNRQPTPISSSRPLFDICLNCDCIYEPLYGRDAWEALADVLAEVAKLSPTTLLVTSVERRVGDGLEDFLQRLEGTGTVQCPIQRVLRNDEDPHHVIEIYVTKGIVVADQNEAG